MAKCPHCLIKFKPTRFLQKNCEQTEECRDHAIKTVLEKNRKLAEKKEKDKWNEEKKVILEKLKTMGDYEADLQTEINILCRMIDGPLGCISCGSKTGKMSAGHYHSRGKNTTLRFNLNNLHQQCFHCNGPMSANIINYNLGLIKWYSKEYQDYVEYKLPLEFPLLKWTKNELILWKAQVVAYKKEVAKLEFPLSAEDRLYWRGYYNEKIGIYKSNADLH
jgi:hypothetical protein